MKDKLHSLTVRLSKEEIEYLKGSAKEAKITPSRFLRMVVNTAMRSERIAIAAAKEVMRERKL